MLLECENGKNIKKNIPLNREPQCPKKPWLDIYFKVYN